MSEQDARARAIAEQARREIVVKHARAWPKSVDAKTLLGLLDALAVEVVSATADTARAQAFEEAAQEGDRYFNASGTTRTDTIRLSELRQWLHARATPTGERPHG
jgi:hypothetical protein